MVLYSNGCPSCNILKNKLNCIGVEYQIIDDMEIFKKNGFRSMPMLEVDGEILTYLEAIKWIREMSQ